MVLPVLHCFTMGFVTRRDPWNISGWWYTYPFATYERAAKPKRLRVGITDEVMVFRRSPYRFTGYLGHSSSTIRSWPCGKGI